MTESTVQRIVTEIEDRPGGRVARVTIDNVRRLNTLNSRLLEDLAAALDALGQDDALRAVVITGAGDKAFVGGADIKEMAQFADGAAARAFITRVHRACKAARDVPVPVIARIKGYCLGAGLELAASCDMRAASLDSVLGMPEVKVGIPSVVEAALLPRLIGWGRTSEFLMAAENIDGATALSWGLVERAVPAEQLDAAVEGWIESILSAGPVAVRAQKALMRRWERLPLDEAVQAGIDAFARSMDTDEPRRLMGHFVNRKR